MWGVPMEFSREETAAFLAAHSAEMARLAETAHLTTLAYLFKMAVIEAENAAQIAASPRLEPIDMVISTDENQTRELHAN